MTNQHDVSRLSDHLGYWLRAVSNHVSHEFIRKLGALETSAGEWVVLRTLFDQQEMAPSQIAVELGLTRGAITKIANRLIERQLVFRTPAPDDGRAQRLALTDRGARLVPRLAALADENDAEWFGQLSQDERNSLARILRQLSTHAGLREVPID